MSTCATDDTAHSTVVRWTDAFPWLTTSVPGGGDWAGPIDDAGTAARQARLAELVALAMEHVPGTPVVELFPLLPLDVPVTALELPTRAARALARFDYTTTSQLRPLTCGTMMGWRAIGVGTVSAILEALANVNAQGTHPELTESPSTTADSDPASLMERETAAALSTDVCAPEGSRGREIGDRLLVIGRWLDAVGRPDDLLLGDGALPGEPAEVREAREYLRGLTAADLRDTDVPASTLASLLDELLAGFDPRTIDILRLRLFADEPATLEELGQAHGVTRERVRQLDNKARATLSDAVSEGGPLSHATAGIRRIIGALRPLEEVIAVMPALAGTVSAVGQPAWRLLDRLDESYEIVDGWCAAPSIAEAENRTRQLLDAAADQHGVVRIDDVSFGPDPAPERTTRSWLERCGYVVDGDHVVTRISSVGDYAAAVLSIEGAPLGAQQIVDRFVHERSARSLANALSTDDRFARVDRDRWALAEWGLEGYAGIKAAIGKELAEAGGAIPLDDLVQAITGRFSVSAASVLAYASNPPYELRGGIVRGSTGGRQPRKAPEHTARLYRHGDAWALRVRVTTEHLRGSGFIAPIAIAGILGMTHGDKVTLASDYDEQTVHWTGNQPIFGTIRRYLLAYDVSAGTEVLLIFGDEQLFTVEVVDAASGDPVRDALVLIGASRRLRGDAARRSFARAVCLPEDSPLATVIGAYRSRGDDDIAELLLAGRSVIASDDDPETGAAPLA
ncbi:sigma factor-like helix-turn-helix DNA-binding protein [Tsukamurella ocularis]|uniref:sigma factor-like helix-turn-helix DNA-binding protein n=1 Tax=Tsukamurella ocularis TaxID=1970234 RepID=UPI0039EEE77A